MPKKNSTAQKAAVFLSAIIVIAGVFFILTSEPSMTAVTGASTADAESSWAWTPIAVFALLGVAVYILLTISRKDF